MFLAIASCALFPDPRAIALLTPFACSVSESLRLLPQSKGDSRLWRMEPVVRPAHRWPGGNWILGGRPSDKRSRLSVSHHPGFGGSHLGSFSLLLRPFHVANSFLRSPVLALH